MTEKYFADSYINYNKSPALRGMLGKLCTSPILIFNSNTCNLFCSFYSASVAANSQFINVNFTISVPPPNATGGHMSRKWELHSTAKIEDKALSNEEMKSWDGCREALSTFQFTTEEKNKILGKAFGHIHSPFWSEERAKEVPRVDVISKVLNFLRSLNLTDADICKILKKFPEVLGCNLVDELGKNVQILEKEWGIEGKMLKNLLLRNPKVLGYNVDCKGDCIAKCTRCWVRF